VFATTLIALLALVIVAVVIIGRGSLNKPAPWTLVKYPVGVTNALEPSGVAPPTSSGIAGFTINYVNDFNGKVIPPGWNVFTGVPSGDPGAHFARAHTVVGGGLLSLNTWRDPAFNNSWVTGGICQCGHSQIYGAYLVRSRVTGSGPNEVELLWPTSNIWPPEIDFNETGGALGQTSATVHFGPTNNIDQSHLSIDMTKWHTFGVVWTRDLITYFVDGHPWGQTQNTGESPTVPMTLDLEQRTSCSVHAQCPQQPVSMLVDWVVDYVPTTTPAAG